MSLKSNENVEKKLGLTWKWGGRWTRFELEHTMTVDASWAIRGGVWIVVALRGTNSATGEYGRSSRFGMRMMKSEK